jgi:S1-C subfamily serine protease
MSSGTSRRALVATALIGFVVGIGVSLRLDLFPRSEAISLFGGGEASEPAPAPPPVTLPDFADLAAAISPSVVNVSTTQEVRGWPKKRSNGPKNSWNGSSSPPGPRRPARRPGWPRRPGR